MPSVFLDHVIEFFIITIYVIKTLITIQERLIHVYTISKTYTRVLICVLSYYSSNILNK